VCLLKIGEMSCLSSSTSTDPTAFWILMTEIAARSNWKKAQIDLDHTLGNLLERNGIQLDEAIAGTVR